MQRSCKPAVPLFEGPGASDCPYISLQEALQRAMRFCKLETPGLCVLRNVLLTRRSNSRRTFRITPLVHTKIIGSLLDTGGQVKLREGDVFEGSGVINHGPDASSGNGSAKAPVAPRGALQGFLKFAVQREGTPWSTSLDLGSNSAGEATCTDSALAIAGFNKEIQSACKWVDPVTHCSAQRAAELKFCKCTECSFMICSWHEQTSKWLGSEVLTLEAGSPGGVFHWKSWEYVVYFAACACCTLV